MASDTYKMNEAVHEAVNDPQLRAAVRRAVTLQDGKRRGRISDYPDRDGLRDLAGRIKQHTLEHLDEYLARFVDAAEAAGAKVHYAQTTEQVHQVVRGVIADSGLRKVIKSKSMVSEEVELDHELEDAAEVVETDLGEFIVQIDHDRPSHIVTPIIHKSAKAIAEVFRDKLGCEYTEDPEELTQIARQYLREKFIEGEIGISGVNFAVAETGTMVLCTNEGNGRMCTSRPKVHIALMGMEKVIPGMEDLAVFLKLLGRSATGQTLTQYTSMITGPRREGELDGPDEVHIVIIDRGRSDNLASQYRQTLRCIRCGACLNVCPVYGAVGGHAYGSVYSGPIGILLTPLYEGFEKYNKNIHATSLCGACYQACPVKIPMPTLFIRMRDEQRAKKITPLMDRLMFWAWTVGLRGLWRYRFGQAMASWFMRHILGRGGWVKWMPSMPGKWTRKRPLPNMAKGSFHKRWKRIRRGLVAGNREQGTGSH